MNKQKKTTKKKIEDEVNLQKFLLKTLCTDLVNLIIK